MKKGTIISLIVAGALLLMGSILWVLGFSCLGGWENLPTQAEKTYIVNEPFTSIQVDATICDVTFVKTDGEFRAVCPDSERLSYTVIVEDGLLQIDTVELQNWWDYIGFFNWTDLKMTVYLPAEVYHTLYVQTDTGDVTIPDSFRFSAAEVLSDTGDIRFAAQAGEQLTVRTSTGDIQVQGSAPSILTLRSDTGDITLQDVHDGGGTQISTTTGNIQVTDVACNSLTCQSDTGDHHLQGVLAESSINMISTTGDVTILGCDAESVDIQTDTGDISGSFLTSKWFQASSGTGDVTVPQTREGGVCRIESSTGDIFFY